MTKEEFIARVARRLKITQSAAERAIDGITDEIHEALLADEDVALRGFGRFSVHHRAAFRCRNPHTGHPVTTPARRRVRFAASKTFFRA